MFETIVLPLDGSNLAEEAIPHATNVGTTLGLKVVLVRVARSPWEYIGFTEYPPETDTDLFEAVVRESREYLEAVGRSLREAGVEEVEERVLRGDPATAIVETLEEVTNGMVVMTSHGRSGLPRMIMGSVADRVLRHSGAPVLMVPADRG